MPSNSVNDDDFNNFWDRIDRLEEEKKGIAEDIKDTYAEMKAAGYDIKQFKEARRQAKIEAHDREEMRMMVDTYLSARGLL